MITEAERLNRIIELLNHVDSLVHGIWMAAGQIESEPERNAIRDMAHHYTGETVGDIIGETQGYLRPAKAA